jgi:uncharacterized protein (TIGR02266 family)
MPERRTASRIEVNLMARYSSDAVSLSGRVCNLSRHGLFLLSDCLDSAGADVTLALSLPGDAMPVKLAGRVMRVVTDPRTPGMGIRFTGVAAAVRRKLANFMIERSYQGLQ